MNVGGVDDRYAAIGPLFVENLDGAANEISEAFEFDEEPISEEVVENRRLHVLPQIIRDHRDNVLGAIERIYREIPNPTAADNALKERLITQVRDQFSDDSLTETIDLVCNEALQRIRGQQQERAEEPQHPEVNPNNQSPPAA